MARQKVKSTIASNAQADDALRQIGELQIQYEVLEAVAQEKINPFKEELQKKGAPLLQQIELLELQLKCFAEDHFKETEEFSPKLQFGSLSFRKSTKILCASGVKMAEVIKRIKKARLGKKLLRIKEELNKDAVREKNYSDERLVELGLRCSVSKQFGYKVNREHISEDAALDRATA